MAELGQCECGNYANYCEGCFDKYMKEEVVKQQAKRIKIPLDAMVIPPDKQIRLGLLKDVLEDFKGVNCEYHQEILERRIEDIENPTPI